MAPQKLLTEKLREQLPALYATEATPMSEKLAVAKFLTPDSNWSWYACEFDGNDTFYGYVQGFESEFGYFSLSELQEARGPLGLPIERDLYFEPTPLVELDSRLKVDADAKREERVDQGLNEQLDEVLEDEEELERSR